MPSARRSSGARGIFRYVRNAPFRRVERRYAPTKAAIASQDITCTGIASALAFGTAKLNLNITPTGIASALAFGTTRVGNTIQLTGVSSAEAFGTPKVNLNIKPVAIASAYASGTAQLNHVTKIFPAGIASAEAFGATSVLQTTPALYNTAEGGTDGAVVTAGNSGGLSGTAFNVVQTAFGAARPRFNAANPINGARSIEIQTNAGENCYFGWNGLIGLRNEIYVRFYLNLTAGTISQALEVFRALEGAASRAGIRITPALQLVMVQANNGFIGSAMSVPVALNGRIRVEARMKFATGATGEMEIRLFNSADSTIMTASISAATLTNGGALADVFRFGPQQSPANAIPAFTIDDVAVGTGGWIGPVTTDLVFSTSGLVGGGAYQQSLAIDPSNGNIMLMGSDIAGYHYTTDGGITWNPLNRGLSTKAWMSIASAYISATGKKYGIGTSGFFRYDDANSTWQFMSSVVQVPGNKAPANTVGIPTGSPRPCGRLIAADTVNSRLFAADFDSGLFRSTDDGLNWAAVALNTGSPKYIRDIVLDPADPTIMLVGVHETHVSGSATLNNVGGLYKLTGLGGAVTATKQTTPFNTVERILYVGNYVVVVGATMAWLASNAENPTSVSGLWYALKSNLNSWTRVGTDTTISKDGRWKGLGGELVGSVINVWITNAVPTGPFGANSRYKNVIQITDLTNVTPTITPITLDDANGQVQNFIGGPSGTPWWLLAVEGSSEDKTLALGGSAMGVTDVVVRPTEVRICGVGGQYTFIRSTKQWYPYIAGLHTQQVKWVKTDPLKPTRMYVGVVPGSGA